MGVLLYTMSSWTLSVAGNNKVKIELVISAVGGGTATDVATVASTVAAKMDGWVHLGRRALLAVSQAGAEEDRVSEASWVRAE